MKGSCVSKLFRKALFRRRYSERSLKLARIESFVAQRVFPPSTKMAQASSLNEQVRDKASNSGRKMLEQEDIVVATGLSFGEDRPCGSRPVKTSASKTADSVASSQDAPTGYYATNTASQPDPKFAKGHSRIVSFNDGTKDCIGILISRNFFTIIIHTARSRHVVQEKQSAVEQAELDVRRVLNSIDGPAILSEAIAKEREATRVRQEIEDGIPELVEARQQVDFLRRELLDPELGLDYDRDGSQAILERVFQQGGLLNFYTSPIRAASVNLGPKGRVAGSQTSSELSCYADSLHPLEYSSDHTFLNELLRT